MSWTETGRYYRTLRDIETRLDLAPDDPLPWQPAYAEIFGTPETLRLALLTRWRTIFDAQHQDLSMAEMVGAHPGLARVAGWRSSADDMAAAS